MKSKNQGMSPVSKIFLEMFSVIFAVLMALGVNEWRENRSNKQLAAFAVETIESEIRENSQRLQNHIETERKRLETNLQSHEEFSDRNMLKLFDLDFDDVIVNKNPIDFGYSRTSLDRTAWDAAMMSQAVKYMDYSLIQAISVAYEKQAFYLNHELEIFKEFGSHRYFSRETTVSQIKSQFVRIDVSLQLGRDLLEAYNHLLEQIREAS